MRGGHQRREGRPSILIGEERHIQSTFYIRSSLYSNHTFIRPSTYPLIGQRNERERTDFPPVCLLGDEKGINVMEDVPASSQGKNIMQSTFTLPATHPPR